MSDMIIDFDEYRELEKGSDIEKELELAIDSFLKDCAKNNKKFFVMFYDDNEKNVKFYYDFRYGDVVRGFEFSEELKSNIWLLGIMLTFKNLEEKYKENGYEVEFNRIHRILRFDLNEYDK